MMFKDMEKKVQNFVKSRQHPTYWGCALAGEAGEFANMCKKHERDGTLDVEKMRLELADVFIYTVLSARFYDIDLEQAILDKIGIVLNRRKGKASNLDNYI